MRVVDVALEHQVANVDEMTGAMLVSELEAAGADHAMVVMVRSGLGIIAERITNLDPGALALLEAADLVDPDADA